MICRPQYCRVKLKHLDEWNTRRREIANWYKDQLSQSELVLPVDYAKVSPVYHLYVVRHARRDDLQVYLGKHGIQSLVHYPLPIHLQPAYADLGYQAGDLPISEAAAQQVLSLPLYPEMTDKMIGVVCQAIGGFFKDRPN